MMDVTIFTFHAQLQMFPTFFLEEKKTCQKAFIVSNRFVFSEEHSWSEQLLDMLIKTAFIVSNRRTLVNKMQVIGTPPSTVVLLQIKLNWIQTEVNMAMTVEGTAWNQAVPLQHSLKQTKKRKQIYNETPLQD